MRDNHTFIHLGNTADKAFHLAIQAAKENPYGMVGPVTILDGTKEIRRVGPHCHVDGDGNVDLTEWWKEIMKDDVVQKTR